MKTKIILLTFFLLECNYFAYSMEKEKEVKPKINKNAIYFEILGNGMFGSLNYTRYFFIKKQLCSSSIGGIFLPRKKLNSHPPYYLFVPLSFNLIFGKIHQYTPSIGLTYDDGLNYSYSNYSGSPFEKYKKSSSVYLFISPIRYQASGLKYDIFFGFQICWFQRIYLFNKDNLRPIDLKDNRYSPFVGFNIGKKF